MNNTANICSREEKYKQQTQTHKSLTFSNDTRRTSYIKTALGGMPRSVFPTAPNAYNGEIVNLECSLFFIFFRAISRPVTMYGSSTSPRTNFTPVFFNNTSCPSMTEKLTVMHGFGMWKVG